MSDIAPTDESTLFVRGLGPSVTSEALEAHFSGVGPIRHAFVVTNPDDPTKCKGFGFVQYPNAEDARVAESLLQGSILGHRKVRLEIAKRRQRKGGRDGTGLAQDVDDDGGLRVTGKKHFDKAGSAGDKTVARNLGNGPRSVNGSTPWAGSLAMRTVVVRAGRSKPAGTVVAEGAVRRAIDAENPDSGFLSCVSTGNGNELRCVYKSWPLAGRAAALIHGTEFSARIDALRCGKRCRIIVRNLPFQVDLEEIRQTFSKPGPVRDINVPPRSSARLPSSKRGVENTVDAVSSLCCTAGYIFIEYFLAAHANHAISTLNGKKIGGRVVAVDLAVAKAVYDSSMGAEPEVADEPPEFGNEQEKVSYEKSVGSTVEVEIADDKNRSQEDRNASPSDINRAEEGHAVLSSWKENSKDPKSSPAELSRTVFVRNLLFETSAAELKDLMAQFGPVEQAVLVVDQTSGRPRGSGFVRFSEESSAEKVLEKGSGAHLGPNVSQSSLAHATQASGIVLGGRFLLVSRAVDRSKARQLVAESRGAEDSKSDPRNLRLAWVGRVKPGTPEAAGLTEEDLRKRAHAEKEKRNKLAHNPNAFVSDVRLSVRNLPRNFDEKVLKHMCILAAEKRKREAGLRDKAAVRVTHVKIVRDEERKGRSKGYGFVQFENHNDAGFALEYLNNNPSAIDVIVVERPKALLLDDERARLFRKQWGSSRRLIVEFSVEDTRQVRIIEEVKKRGREKAAAIEAERRDNDNNISSDRAAGGEGPVTKVVFQKVGDKRIRGCEETNSSIDGCRHRRPAKRLNRGARNSGDSSISNRKDVRGAKQVGPVENVRNSAISGRAVARKQHVAVGDIAESAVVAGSATQKRRKTESSALRNHEKRFEDLVEQYKRKLAATRLASQ